MTKLDQWRIGIIGAGLIGGKRATALEPAQDCLTWVADLSLDRATKVAATGGEPRTKPAHTTTDWRKLAASPDVDAVIVATTNDQIPLIAAECLKSGKHVLVEKPGGRHPAELAELQNVSDQVQRTTGHILRVGFNHRFHPAFLGAKPLVDSGDYGPLMYIRARYGHGGRVGYDREWRADPKIAGGGELLDQGVHLIDLCRWLGGEFELKTAHVGTYFWDMPVEDNGFLLLESPDGKRHAHLHASCTEWKNLFDFEIFLRYAKIQIWGLGRSYGTEELRIFKMKPEMGPPDTEVRSFPGEDRSWHDEWEAFRQQCNGSSAVSTLGKINDACRAIEIVHAAYRTSGVAWAKP
ncbi:MAG: Gfo/Idh/MocA family oxidoreductase [Bdellovibrionota bacterium]